MLLLTSLSSLFLLVMLLLMSRLLMILDSDWFLAYVGKSLETRGGGGGGGEQTKFPATYSLLLSLAGFLHVFVCSICEAGSGFTRYPIDNQRGEMLCHAHSEPG